jgi:hypothetical protein
MPRQTVPEAEPAWSPPLVRALIILRFLGESLFLVLAVRAAYSAPSASARFFVWFYAARLAILAGAAILARARRQPRFYLAAISDLPDMMYWCLVLFALTALNLVAAGQFGSQDVFVQLGEYGTAIVAGSLLLMMYQSRLGTTATHHNRERRIGKLVRKAGLSNAEFEAIAPQLAAVSQANQRRPWAWSVFVVLFAAVIGAVLNAFAGQLVNTIQAYLPFTHILFP